VDNLSPHEQLPGHIAYRTALADIGKGGRVGAGILTSLTSSASDFASSGTKTGGAANDSKCWAILNRASGTHEFARFLRI